MARKTSRRVSRAGRAAVTRAEFNRLRDTVEQCRRDLEIQFKRIASIQAEIDHRNGRA